MAFSSQTYKGYRVAYMGSDGPQNKLHAVYFYQKNEKFIGSILISLELDITTSSRDDWESISLGPCDSKDESDVCIYVGNIGNNGAHICTSRTCTNGRNNVKIYKFREPSLSSIRFPGQTLKVSVATILLSYRDNFPAANNDGKNFTLLRSFNSSNSAHFCRVAKLLDSPTAEAMFVDNLGDYQTGDRKGDIYIFTRNPNDKSQMRIGKIPVSVHANLGENEIMRVPFQVLNGGPPYLGALDYDYTEVDLSSDGRLIALRTNYQVYYFPRIKDQSIFDAVGNITANPCPWISETPIQQDNEWQYESVAFAGKNFIAEASECDNSNCEVPVYIYELLKKGEVGGDSKAFDGWDGAVETTITYDDFNNTGNDWGRTNFVSGGDNAILVGQDVYGYPNQCFNSSSMAQIQDNNGLASTFYHSQSHDCRSYDQINVSFRYFSAALEPSDNFFLEYSQDGGNDWMIVAEWSKGALPGYQCYTASVDLTSSDLGGFTEAVKFRFRSNSDRYHDYVYFVEIDIKGIVFC